jgi:hypothetical protein
LADFVQAARGETRIAGGDGRENRRVGGRGRDVGERGKTGAPALCISRCLDRDRAVDEAGNQIAVFSRVGARPFTFEEMTRFNRLPNDELFTVPEIRTVAAVLRESSLR